MFAETQSTVLSHQFPKIKKEIAPSFPHTNPQSIFLKGFSSNRILNNRMAKIILPKYFETIKKRPTSIVPYEIMGIDGYISYKPFRLISKNGNYPNIILKPCHKAELLVLVSQAKNQFGFKVETFEFPKISKETAFKIKDLVPRKI